MRQETINLSELALIQDTHLYRIINGYIVNPAVLFRPVMHSTQE
jgi:hypothetical protein